MITENAIVVSVTDTETWIETQRKSVCGQCSASKGCGTSVLSKVMGNKLSKMKAINKVDAQTGDEVVVGLNEQMLLKGAFMTYLMPLLFLFLFAFIGQVLTTNLQLQKNEIVVVLFSIIGFYFGLRQLKKFSISISEDENYQPVILEKADRSSVFVKL